MNSMKSTERYHLITWQFFNIYGDLLLTYPAQVKTTQGLTKADVKKRAQGFMGMRENTSTNPIAHNRGTYGLMVSKVVATHTPTKKLIVAVDNT